MGWFKKLRIKQKIAISTFFVIVLVTILAWSCIQLFVVPSLINELAGRCTTIAKSIRERGHEFITEDDKPNLLDLIYTEKWMEPCVVYIFVMDEMRDVMAHTFLKTFPHTLVYANQLPVVKERNTMMIETSYGNVYDTALGVYEGINRIATVRVGLNKTYIDRVIHNLRRSLFAIMVFIISTALILINWFSVQITKPILMLNNLASMISRGDVKAGANLIRHIRSWRLKECDQTECPLYKDKELPCWFLGNSSRNKLEERLFPVAISHCRICRAYNVGDEIKKMSDAFCHMVVKIGFYQEVLKRTNEDLRKLNENYMNMLSFVAHELKAPIANSSMSARALKQHLFGELNDSQEEMVELICRNLDQSLDMVKNYLDLSRIEKEEIILHAGPVRLDRDVIRPVLADFAALTAQRAMRVENTVGDDVVVEADQELLRILYSNLVSNACKYGKDHGTIRLAATDRGSTYRLEVYNEGVGVPKESMGQLFMKFQRINQAGHKFEKGTGLGLFICEDIVNRHGGRIWAEGAEGEWINFIAEIPKKFGGRGLDESEENTDN